MSRGADMFDWGGYDFTIPGRMNGQVEQNQGRIGLC